MNVDAVVKHIEWEQYYNRTPLFWSDPFFYIFSWDMSEDFIREFQDSVSWELVSRCCKLSEDFIREFQDRVDWSCVSQYQTLSEQFIKEFRDKVHWGYISKYQKLSEEFVREFQDRINWPMLKLSKYIPESVKLQLLQKRSNK